MARTYGNMGTYGEILFFNELLQKSVDNCLKNLFKQNYQYTDTNNFYVTVQRYWYRPSNS
jgi:hypothetical protein